MNHNALPLALSVPEETTYLLQAGREILLLRDLLLLLPENPFQR
jgi:hypothetical protein